MRFLEALVRNEGQQRLVPSEIELFCGHNESATPIHMKLRRETRCPLNCGLSPLRLYQGPSMPQETTPKRRADNRQLEQVLKETDTTDNGKNDGSFDENLGAWRSTRTTLRSFLESGLHVVPFGVACTFLNSQGGSTERTPRRMLGFADQPYRHAPNKPPSKGSQAVSERYDVFISYQGIPGPRSS